MTASQLAVLLLPLLLLLHSHFFSKVCSTRGHELTSGPLAVYIYIYIRLHVYIYI